VHQTRGGSFKGLPDGWDFADCGVGSVVVVVVEPCWQGVAAGLFGGVEVGEGPAVGEGAMEAFDLPLVWRR
jgi:hypothetical protein